MARHHERLPWREMISARFGLDECNEGLAAMQERRVLKAAVVPSPGA
jgi:hypothetical protein